MNKKIKLSLAIIVLSLLSLPQNTRGAFGVEANHVTAYIISEASYEVTVDTISETFTGFQVNTEVQEEDTKMVVNVESVDVSQLTWNSTVNNQTITGICPDTFDYDPFYDFFHAASEAISDIDFILPYSTGIILPVYFDPFELPLFVSIAPVTWTNMENMITYQDSILSTRLSLYYITAMGGNWDNTGKGNIASLEFWYNHSVTSYDGSTQDIYSSTNFRYNMTTGSLLDAEIGIIIEGIHSNNPAPGSFPYSIIGNYVVEVTEDPDGFDFLEFLSDNKWYFIGGGGGLVVVGTATGIGLKARGKGKGKAKKGKKK